MIIIKHGDSISVSNEAEIGTYDRMSDDRKSMEKRKVIKAKHVFNLDTEARRNEQVECLMQAGGGYVTFAGFIDKISPELTTIAITSENIDIEKFSKFVKHKI